MTRVQPLELAVRVKRQYFVEISCLPAEVALGRRGRAQRQITCAAATRKGQANQDTTSRTGCPCRDEEICASGDHCLLLSTPSRTELPSTARWVRAARDRSRRRPRSEPRSGRSARWR